MTKVSKYGQWQYPGEDTIIPNVNGSITMQGVSYPVLGIDDLGNQQMMLPGANYQFPGNSVYEIPFPHKNWTDSGFDRGIGKGTGVNWPIALTREQKALDDWQRLTSNGNPTFLKRYPVPGDKTYEQLLSRQNGGDISVPSLKRVKIHALPKAQEGSQVSNTDTWHEFLNSVGVTEPSFHNISQQQIDNVFEYNKQNSKAYPTNYEELKKLKKDISAKGEESIKNSAYNDALTALIDAYNDFYPMSELGSRSQFTNAASMFGSAEMDKKRNVVFSPVNSDINTPKIKIPESDWYDYNAGRKQLPAEINNQLAQIRKEQIKKDASVWSSDSGNKYRVSPIEWVDASPKYLLKGDNVDKGPNDWYTSKIMFRHPIDYYDKTLNKTHRLLSRLDDDKSYRENWNDVYRDTLTPAIYPKPEYSVKSVKPTMQEFEYTDKNGNLVKGIIPAVSRQDSETLRNNLYYDVPGGDWLTNYKNKVELYNLTQKNLGKLKQYDPNFQFLPITDNSETQKKASRYEKMYLTDPSVGFYQNTANEEVEKPCEHCESLYGSTESSNAQNTYRTYGVQYPSLGIYEDPNKILSDTRRLDSKNVPQTLKRIRQRYVDYDYMDQRGDTRLSPNEIPVQNLSPGLRNPDVKTNVPVQVIEDPKLRSRRINEEIQNRQASFAQGGPLPKAQDMGQVNNWERNLYRPSTEPNVPKGYIKVPNVIREARIAKGTPEHLVPFIEKATPEQLAEKEKREWAEEVKNSPRPKSAYDSDPAGLPSVPIIEAALMAPVALGEAGLAGLGEAVYSSAAGNMLGNALVTSPTWAPGLSLANAANAGFITHGISQLPETYRTWDNTLNHGGSYANALVQTALNAMDLIGTGEVEGLKPAFEYIGKGLKTAAKYPGQLYTYNPLATKIEDASSKIVGYGKNAFIADPARNYTAYKTKPNFLTGYRKIKDPSVLDWEPLVTDVKGKAEQEILKNFPILTGGNAENIDLRQFVDFWNAYNNRKAAEYALGDQLTDIGRAKLSPSEYTGNGFEEAFFKSKNEAAQFRKILEQQNIQKDSPLGKLLGSGAEGFVYELAHDPRNAIKIGQTFKTNDAQDLVNSFQGVDPNNIAVVKRAHQEGNSLIGVMPNLDKSGEFQNLTKAEVLDKLEKDARGLMDKGFFLDVDNLNNNFRYNRNKNVVDIYDVSKPSSDWSGQNQDAVIAKLRKHFEDPLRIPEQHPLYTPKPFKSEIDWAKWNPETVQRPELLEEYNAIEKASKENGTWMKNPDGSDFVPSPLAQKEGLGEHQFIMEQSRRFKEAYPNGFDTTYRGLVKGDPDFSLPTEFHSVSGDKAIFTSNKDLAHLYTYLPDSKEAISMLPTTSPKESGVMFELLHPAGNEIRYNAGNSHWTNVNLAKNSTMEKLVKQYEFTKQYVNTLKERGIDPESIKNVEKQAEETLRLIKEYDQPHYNWEEFAKMKDKLGDFTSTNSIAEYLEKSKLNKIKLENVEDPLLGDVTIVNNKPGNYLKSRIGNVGDYDLNNPNVFKALLPPALLLGAGAAIEQKKGGEHTKFQNGGGSLHNMLQSAQTIYKPQAPASPTTIQKQMNAAVSNIKTIPQQKYYNPAEQYKEKLTAANSAFEIPEEYYNQLMIQENSIKKGFNENKYYPYKSLEGGNNTIGYGHKLTDDEVKSGKYANGLTEQEARDLMVQDVLAHKIRANESYDKVYGKGAFDKLSPQMKLVTVDFVYNGVPVTKFPNFFGAANDYFTSTDPEVRKEAYNKMRQNSTRVDGNNNPLVSRNQFTESYLSAFPEAKGYVKTPIISDAKMETLKANAKKKVRVTQPAKFQDGGMPLGLPLKEQNIYLLPEYYQPKNPKTGEILPDPQRPGLGMDTGATEYKYTYDTNAGNIDIPSIVAGQYIGDQALDRYNLTGERFKTMNDPSSYSKFYDTVSQLGIMQEKKKGGELKRVRVSSLPKNWKSQ